MYTIIHVHKNGTATCILPEKVQLRPVMLADTQPIFPEILPLQRFLSVHVHVHVHVLVMGIHVLLPLAICI